MISDETYELCLPALQDSSIEDEDKADKLEELLKERTNLTEQALEYAVLDVLWRHRDGGRNVISPPLIRQTIRRRPSRVSWRGSATPRSGSSPLVVGPLALPGLVPWTFGRTKSRTVSLFPFPVFSLLPPVPHSPSLSRYQFANDDSLSHEVFEDYESENVDWLVNDDDVSETSSLSGSSGLNAAAPEFVSSRQSEMTPYDMLRSILGQFRTDEEVDSALAMHAYDLDTMVTALMDPQLQNNISAARQVDDVQDSPLRKSMAPDTRQVSPADTREYVVACDFVSAEQRLRSDCRFSHDPSNYICNTPPTQKASINLQDYTTFPSLEPGASEQLPLFAAAGSYPSVGITPPPGFKPLHRYNGERSQSRLRSQHRNHKNAGQTPPALDDTDAFPPLGSDSVK